MQELAHKEEQTEVPIHSKEEENKEDHKNDDNRKQR